MRRFTIHTTSPTQTITRFARPWGPSLGTWAVGAGSAVFLLLSVTPLVREEVLLKLPILKSYYEDKVPASDKPF